MQFTLLRPIFLPVFPLKKYYYLSSSLFLPPHFFSLPLSSPPSKKKSDDDAAVLTVHDFPSFTTTTKILNPHPHKTHLKKTEKARKKKKEALLSIRIKICAIKIA